MRRALYLSWTFPFVLGWLGLGFGPAGARGADAPVPDEAYASIPKYEFGKSRKELAAIEEAVRGGSPAELGVIEEKLLEALETPGATYAGKQFVLRLLRRIGTGRSVPVLGKLLGDEKLSHMARFALEGLADRKVDDVFLDALGKLRKNPLIGLVGSVGHRGDRRAVMPLSRYVTADDPALAAAAIKALGHIGGSEAARVLRDAKARPEHRTLVADAMLLCADGMLAGGRTGDAISVYRSMAAPGKPKFIRIAAYRGLARAEKEKAVPAIVSLLESEDDDLRQAGRKFLTELPGTDATRKIAGEISSRPKEIRIILLEALALRGDRSAARAVEDAAGSSDENVQVQAIRTLGVVGDESSVEPLARWAAQGGGTGEAARESLARLRGAGISRRLISLLRTSSDAAVRLGIVDVLVRRRDQDVLPGLVKIAESDRDAGVRKSAHQALGALGGQAELRGLLNLLVRVKDGDERQSVRGAIVSIAGRVEDAAAAAAPLLPRMDRMDGETQAGLLGVFPHLAGETTLEAARKALKSDDLAVRKAAIGALGEWPDAAPARELLALARSVADPECRSLALGGYIRLISLPANRPAAEGVRRLEEAFEMANRIGERRQVVEALPRFASDEALKLAERYTDDSDVGREAAVAVKKIKEALINRSLIATASANAGNAKLAVDGNPDTRWDSGHPMQPGDWFMVDLGQDGRVKGVALDVSGSSMDYPRGYEVYVSFDGKTWGKPLTSGKGRDPVTRIAFPEPVHARFIKIVQTGKSGRWYWSIHRLQVEFD